MGFEINWIVKLWNIGAGLNDKAQGFQNIQRKGNPGLRPFEEKQNYVYHSNKHLMDTSMTWMCVFGPNSYGKA